MTTMSSGWMFLLVPAHPGCPGQNTQSRKTVVCVCVSNAECWQVGSECWRPWMPSSVEFSCCWLVLCIWQPVTTGILLFSRLLTPITATHYKHLSSARFFAVSFPSHMLLINCSLFLPLVHFPVIRPSRMSHNNTSCRRTCTSHLRFHWFIVLMIHLFSSTRFRTSELLTFAV